MPAVFFTGATVFRVGTVFRGSTVFRGATVFTGATTALEKSLFAGEVDILNNFGAAGTFASGLATGADTKVGAMDEVTTA